MIIDTNNIIKYFEKERFWYGFMLGAVIAVTLDTLMR